MRIFRNKITLPLIFILAFFIMAQEANAETRMMILLDVSGTMNSPGTPGTEGTKYDEVKTGVDEMLRLLPAEIDVGLRIMGGSATADCYTSYLYQNPIPGMRSYIQDYMASFKPAGNRGLCQGIEDSITDLSVYAPGDDKVILVITDGGDDCGLSLDNVAKAHEYQSNRPMIVIYGLDLLDKDKTEIGDFAARMDGRFSNYDSTADFNSALQTFAGEFTKNLRIHLTDSTGAGVQGDIVIKNISLGSVTSEALDVTDYSFNLDPGSYEVTGRYLGQEKTSGIFTLGANESKTISLVFTIYLEPFTVTLKDIYGNPIRGRLTFYNSSYEPVLTTGLDTTHRVELPADTYTIEYRVGDKTLKIDGVLIGPNYESVREIDVPIELGVLEVEITNTDGKPLNARVKIFDSDGTLIDEAASTSYLYSRLPSGNYHITAEYGDTKTETDTSLLEGDQKQVGLELSVQLGDIYVKLRTEGGDDVWGYVKVYDSAGNLMERWDPERMESPDWNIIDLPAGTYRIEATADNVVRVVNNVEVKADQETEVEVTFPEPEEY